MTDVIAGIKEEDLRALSLEILSYRDNIGITLGEIEGLMDSLKNYYQGPPCKKILAKYEKLSDQYKTLGDNLKDYSKDLQAVIGIMHAGDKKFTFSFDTFASETQQKIRSTKEIIPRKA